MEPRDTYLVAATIAINAARQISTIHIFVVLMIRPAVAAIPFSAFEFQIEWIIMSEDCSIPAYMESKGIISVCVFP